MKMEDEEEENRKISMEIMDELIILCQKHGSDRVVPIVFAQCVLAMSESDMKYLECIEVLEKCWNSVQNFGK